MPTALIVVLVQLLAQYGPTVVNEIISLGKSSDAPTLDQLNALHSMLKTPDSYFGDAPAPPVAVEPPVSPGSVPANPPEA